MPAPFTFFVTQFAHTDIGYTHPPDVIRWMYLEHYDRVLELCAASVNAPEETRFKWVCETAWQVRHYLQHRPEREAELVEYARRGQIELIASDLHFTDLIDPDALRRSMEWVLAFCRRHDLPLRSALHCDINGWPWALADVLSEAGVEFFCSAVHIDSATDPLGKRGSVHYHWLKDLGANLAPGTPIRTPQAFRWRGPGGGEVLHFLGEHYHLGNSLGVSSDYPFHADKSRHYEEADTLTADQLYELAARELPAYLARIQADGYAHSVGLLHTSGFFVDNSRPDDRWLRVIERWNAEHDDLKLRTATLSEWFGALKAQPEVQAGELPTHQVAWPDHWAHGLGSMTARVAQARRSQRRRPQVARLVEASGSAAARYHLERALDHERFALEHTFDHWSTTARPDSTPVAYAQAEKELAFFRTEQHLDEAADLALRSMIPAGGEKRLHFPADQAGRTLHFAVPDATFDPAQGVLTSPDGQTFPVQLDRANPPGYLTAVRGMGSARLVPLAQATDLRAASTQLDPLAGMRQVSAPTTAANRLENAHWQLELDTATGALSSLRALGGKEGSREWVQPGAAYGFGQLVREFVVHPRGRQAVGNFGRLLSLGVGSEKLREYMGDAPTFSYATLKSQPGENGAAAQRVSGPVYDALEWQASQPDFGALRVQWRTYHALPLLELVLDWHKPWSELPEAAYVAFPFAQPGGLQLDAGGFFTPGSHDAGGQLPGTSHSYYTVGRGARVSGSDGQRLILAAPDAPLMMTQQINYARWNTEPYTWNGLLASMPVNHYWHTNFPTSQRGPLRLRYRFVPLGEGTDETAEADEALAWLQALPVDALGWR
ncbi:hypothetical protein [Deinococcus sp.]|uniref:glycoside hydrolase family 38 N-terminal domain-containing protein n=1 Tax=Deinococcus sp. TaxID=47478 RepID=UPI003C7AC435